MAEKSKTSSVTSNHEVVRWEKQEFDLYSSGYRTALHVAVCSCGEEITCSHPTGVKGNVSSTSRRIYGKHAYPFTIDSRAMDSPMILVGTIKKVRVTHEVWIYSRLGERDADLPERGSDYSPWCVAVKKSNGWHANWYSFRHLEMAYADALVHLENERGQGYEIKIASQVDIDAVEVPVGAIEEYLSKLVDDAKELTKPKDLVELQGRIKRARSMLEILEAAQEHVEMKLLGLPTELETPEEEEDSSYEEYEYTPS